MRQFIPKDSSIYGKVVWVMPETLIKVKNRTSYMQEYVMETGEDYQYNIAFTVYGKENIDKMDIKVGDYISAFFNIRSYSIGGKWFTTVNAYKVIKRHPSQSEISTKRNKESLLPY